MKPLLLEFCITIKSKVFFIALLLLSGSRLFSQNEIQLGLPIEIPLALSGNFAELRGDHFHAGVDIKTKGRQGLKVNAVEKGSIRRIRVSTTGYGKSLYLEHNNGLTTVYAHLQKFAPKIESLIKSIQYEKQTFEVQKFLRKGELTVTQGELIGYSGNTGGSFGPHLHFEVRNSDTQRPLNPLRMGLPVKDTQRPQLQQLYLFDEKETLHQVVPLQKMSDSVYRTDLIQVKGKIGFGLGMFDRQDFSYNRNGIYKAELILNGRTVYSYQLDQIDFKDQKFIPLFIDYPLLKKNKRYIYKLFTPKHSELSFLSNVPSDGVVTIQEGKSYQLKIVIADFQGNRSYLETYIDGKQSLHSFEPHKVDASTHSLLPERDYLIDFGKKGVYFSKESFFNPAAINCEPIPLGLDLELPLVPVRKDFEVFFNPPSGDSLKIAQTAIIRTNEKGEISFLNTQKKKERWEAKTKEGGRFYLARDRIEPLVEPVNFKEGQWLSRFRYLKIRIDDSDSGIQSYRGTLNGHWILFEYEPKLNLLTYDFSDKTFEAAEHKLELEVKDGVGNRTLYQATIFRKYNLEE